MGLCSSTLGKTKLEKIPATQALTTPVPVVDRAVHCGAGESAAKTPSTVVSSPVMHTPLTVFEESPASLPNSVHFEMSERGLTPILEEALNELADPIIVIDKMGERIIYMNKIAKEKIGERYLENNFSLLIPNQFSAQSSAAGEHAARFFADSLKSDERKKMVHNIPLIVQPYPNKPAVELIVSMYIARLSNGFVIKVMETAHLLDVLQKTVKQQKAIMHEGRNVRNASLAHLGASLEALQHGINELEVLLSTAMPEPIASKVKESLSAMQRAHQLLRLAIACDQYTSIVENYLLSPDDKEEFALCAWVNSMIDMLSSDAIHIPIRKAGLLATPMEYIVHGHKAVLLYVLVNLIQNAIKFSQPKLSASYTKPLDITISLYEEEGAFWFSVADKGIGMSNDQVVYCLDRGAKRFNTSIQGSGSGLGNINEALIKIGGLMSVVSSVGDGTTFKLTLPLTLVKKVIQKADYSKLCVLVADDVLINKRIFARLLISLGVSLKNIFPVSSGAEAFMVYKKQHEMGRSINIIFTDLNMGSEDDGFLLAEQVRAFETSNSLESIPIMVVSGTACEKNNPKRALVNGEMLKPISPEAVATVLMNVKTDTHSPVLSLLGEAHDAPKSRL